MHQMELAEEADRLRDVEPALLAVASVREAMVAVELAGVGRF